LLTVNEDRTPPQCVGASASPSLTNIVVRFSEFMDQMTAEDTFNYSVSGGLSVLAVGLNPDRSSVTLRLSGLLTPGATYQVTVKDVNDLANNPISPNPCISTVKGPVISCGFLVFQTHGNESTSDNTIDTTLLADPNFPNNPRDVF